ncbi:HNH endonuclease signature motif containing protein [Streptomyces anulatus]|uniref:HNH endonuclease signature motif containing protein n=1 Tax=Streptomyces anulatus TaxID=1892 RepID=UPI0036FDDB5C
MHKDRPKTPSEVKRKLRQHARFGCCGCGLPIYQYHHIVPYSEDQHFRVADMMLLCPLCHDKATKGVFSDAQQREMQETPFNVRNGLAGGMLHTRQNYCAVLAGGVLMVGEGPVITVNGESVLTLNPDEGGHVRLSATLRDRSGNLVALIEDNEWLSGDTAVWDMESDHQKLVIRSAANQVALNLNMKGEPAHLRAKFWQDGYMVDLRGIGIRVNGVGAGQQISEGVALAGMTMDIDTRIPSVQLVPQLQKGLVVSEPDPLQRLKRAAEAWRKLKSEEPGSTGPH